MPKGVEVDKKYACLNLVVRNHSDRDILYTLPGRTGRAATVVAIARGMGMVAWMDKTFTVATSWTLFVLKEPPNP